MATLGQIYARNVAEATTPKEEKQVVSVAKPAEENTDKKVKNNFKQGIVASINMPQQQPVQQ